MTARILPDGPEGRAAAAEVLRNGGLVALPTDTVYGIAVALETPGGIERLFAAKDRPTDKAIILLLADPDQADSIGVMTPAARVLAAAGWPGGLTLVLAQRTGARVPAVLTAGTDTIGVRVPNHPAPRALAAAVGPLPTTSANRSGLPVGSTAAEILDQLGDALDIVLDGGPAPGARASTVVDCSTDLPRLLRDGAIPATALAAVLDDAELPHALAGVPG
jgi:L-threonylcarbamoyladenylate synthase